MATLTTQDMIDSFITVYGTPSGDSRQQYILEQTLHALVRLAKSEQMLEIKASVRKLTAPLPTASAIQANNALPRN